MAVAKYKLEIDRQIRETGCVVKSGRIYRADGVFWGTRSEVIDWWSGGEDRREKWLKMMAECNEKFGKKD